MKESAIIGTIRVSNKDGRLFIKTEMGWEAYSVYVAKQNPDICGKWFKGCEVHHKDFDCTNDTPENLICLSKKEHRDIHIQEDNRYNAAKIDIFQKGKYVCTVNSRGEAARFCNIPACYVSYLLNGKPFPKGRYSHLNYTFKYASLA